MHQEHRAGLGLCAMPRFGRQAREIPHCSYRVEPHLRLPPRAARRYLQSLGSSELDVRAGAAARVLDDRPTPRSALPGACDLRRGGRPERLNFGVARCPAR
jgi:hypothetical protein